jgi:endonuclease YncB( thermonuclease family)
VNALKFLIRRFFGRLVVVLVLCVCEICVLLFFLLFALASLAAELSGKVVGVSDGDTFTLLLANNSTVRIRLNGIDTPEMGQPFAHIIPPLFGNSIFQELRNMVL